MTNVSWSADSYDAFYSTAQAKKENAEIKRLLNLYFSDIDSVVDLGCGTGFGQDMIPSHIKYHGIDVDEKMVAHCIKHRKGRFTKADARDAVSFYSDPKMALFSLTDFPVKTIFQFAREKKAFAVAYNRPYLKDSASAWHKKRLHFFSQYGTKTILAKCLLMAAGFNVFKLLDEPYYFVAVK